MKKAKERFFLHFKIYANFFFTLEIFDIIFYGFGMSGCTNVVSVQWNHNNKNKTNNYNIILFRFSYLFSMFAAICNVMLVLNVFELQAFTISMSVWPRVI